MIDPKSQMPKLLSFLTSTIQAIRSIQNAVDAKTFKTSAAAWQKMKVELLLTNPRFGDTVAANPGELGLQLAKRTEWLQKCPEYAVPNAELSEWLVTDLSTTCPDRSCYLALLELRACLDDARAAGLAQYRGLDTRIQTVWDELLCWGTGTARGPKTFGKHHSATSGVAHVRELLHLRSQLEGVFAYLDQSKKLPNRDVKRILFDSTIQGVILDGRVLVQGLDKDCAILIEELISAWPNTVSFPDIVRRRRKEGIQNNPTRVKEKLPPDLLKLLDAVPGKGTRIVLGPVA